MGPYAGLDLVKKIFDLTEASTDQEHLPVALLSYPGWIRDRSEFLFEGGGVNPAEAMFQIAKRLDALGAVAVGIPCNTAHAPAIFDVLYARMAEEGLAAELVHMIHATAAYIRSVSPDIQRVGVLSTLASYRLKLYGNCLAREGLEPIVPDENVQENIVNRTIFDPTYGIKAQANPVSQIARQSLISAIEQLRSNGAEAVVLGCTELPLAIPEDEIDSLPIIDPTEVLARTLILKTYPDRLKS